MKIQIINKRIKNQRTDPNYDPNYESLRWYHEKFLGEMAEPGLMHRS